MQGGCGSIVGLVSLAVYLYTSYPGIPGGDSGELITAAHELGVAHPPGYPLFTVLAWSSIKVTQWATVAWRVAALNALLSALAGAVFAQAIVRYTDSVSSGILGASLWCFSHLTWTWSVTTEVFSLNNLFTASLLYLMAEFDHSCGARKTKVARFGAFMCSLSLCNQHTQIVYTSIVAVWVLTELLFCRLLTARLLLQLGLCFTVGLTPYSYLPLSAHYRPGRWTWGDQRTIAGFIKHLLRQEYGTFDLGKAQSGGGFLAGMRLYGDHITSGYTTVGMMLCLLGIIIAIYRCITGRQRSLIVAATMAVVYLLLFSWRANLDLDNQLFLGVVERFWMQADCVVVLLACVTTSQVFSVLRTKISAKLLVYAELFIATTVGAVQIQRNWDTCNHHDNTIITEFASRLLDNMPQNAIVLTRGDLPSNTLRYLYLCENKRPDLQVFDQEVLTYDWSVAMMRDSYPGIEFPGVRMDVHTGYLPSGTQVFNFHTFLDANYNRSPIVACIGVQDHEPSWQTHYHLFPFGPCSLLLRIDKPFNMEQWIAPALNISLGWSYPYDGFEPTSWERVATNEMWQAKISIAFYLYGLAQQSTDASPKQKYTIRSYQLYTSAIDSHEPADIPRYWHLNYALVCERMLSLDHDVDTAELVRKAIHHFQAYITDSPDDTDYDAIQQVIQHLRKFVE